MSRIQKIQDPWDPRGLPVRERTACRPIGHPASAVGSLLLRPSAPTPTAIPTTAASPEKQPASHHALLAPSEI